MNLGKGGKWKNKSRFFGVTLGFVQDCKIAKKNVEHEIIETIFQLIIEDFVRNLCKTVTKAGR